MRKGSVLFDRRPLSEIKLHENEQRYEELQHQARKSVITIQ